MATQTHNKKLNQKRAERQRKDVEDSPAEKREVLMHGAKLKCLINEFGITCNSDFNSTTASPIPKVKVLKI